MHVVDGIRKHGFRKWYERELIQGHLHLVVTLLSAVGLLAAFELFPDSDGPDRVVNFMGMAICAALVFWSLRRYLYLLMHAEEVANQAVCPRCATYGRFELSGFTPADNDAPVQVRCKHCEYIWKLQP